MNEKELFEKVYDVLFEHGRDFVEASRKTDSQVPELLENIYEVTGDKPEEILDCFMEIISDERRDSFTLGLKYAVKTIFALLSK